MNAKHAIFLLWLSAASTCALAANQADAPSRAALAVELTSPKTIELPEKISLSGNIAPWQEAGVASATPGLRIVRLMAEVGDRVKKGQTLAILEDETLSAEGAQSQAVLGEAKSALADAEANLTRAKDLAAQGFYSAQQVQNATAASQSAKARVATAEAAVRMSAARLAGARVVAPDDGVVSQRSVGIGMLTPAGQDLFRLIRQGRLEWRAETPSSILARIKPGQAALITTPSGSAIKGIVSRVSPVVDASSRNGIAHVEIDAAGLPLASPGMFAKGSITLGSRKVLSLPASAVILRDGSARVFKVGTDSIARLVKVTVLGQDDQQVAIEGLLPTDKIAASGGGFLSDGDKVRVVGPLGAKP